MRFPWANAHFKSLGLIERWIFHNTTCGGHIGNTVDQDQFSQCLMLCKSIINDDLFLQYQIADRNLVLAQAANRNKFTGVDINLVLDIPLRYPESYVSRVFTR